MVLYKLKKRTDLVLSSSQKQTDMIYLTSFTIPTKESEEETFILCQRVR